MARGSSNGTAIRRRRPCAPPLLWRWKWRREYHQPGVHEIGGGTGGGNGRFADRLPAQYPKTQATVLETSQLLLDRNQPNKRKAVVSDSVENLARLLQLRRHLRALPLASSRQRFLCPDPPQKIGDAQDPEAVADTAWQGLGVREHVQRVA